MFKLQFMSNGNWQTLYENVEGKDELFETVEDAKDAGDCGYDRCNRRIIDADTDDVVSEYEWVDEEWSA